MTKEEIIKQLTQQEPEDVDRMELLKSYPEPVSRYLRYHLPEGIPDRAFSITPMKGIIKLVNWALFKSVLYANPFKGFMWEATVKMGILPVKGYDYFLENKGAMQWTLFNIIPVNKAEGANVSRSAEGRAMLEAIFTPHLLISPKVRWDVISENEVTVNWNLYQEDKAVHLIIGDDGSLQKAFAERWGNPGDTREWAYHKFGVNVEREIKRKGIVIPSKGNAGWWFGQKEYDDGEFFRFEVI